MSATFDVPEAVEPAASATFPGALLEAPTVLPTVPSTPPPAPAAVATEPDPEPATDGQESTADSTSLCRCIGLTCVIDWTAIDNCCFAWPCAVGASHSISMNDCAWPLVSPLPSFLTLFTTFTRPSIVVPFF